MTLVWPQVLVDSGHGLAAPLLTLPLTLPARWIDTRIKHRDGRMKAGRARKASGLRDGNCLAGSTPACCPRLF